jgi:hypothetical protein
MRRLLLMTLILGTFGVLPDTAMAGFSPATLLSAREDTQFEEADAPALSEDGHYAVFQGVVDETPGIYRRDLLTGAVVPVAAAANSVVNPAAVASEELSAPDAAGPSISEHGEYVAFTTTADLPTRKGMPSNEQRCPSVYVRNMNLSPDEEGAYTLASVLGGPGSGEPERPISYGPGPCSSSSLPTPKFPIDGAQAAPAVALSADGSKVVFTVLSPSNLGDPECVEAECMTPPSQVVLRDLDARTTTLVSVTPQGLPTPEGGAYPSADSEQEMSGPIGPSNFSRLQFGDLVTGSSAAISADGSTVAWLGTDADEQAGAGPGGPEEVEPLWRRVADGPTATTKRLLSDAGLEFGYFGTYLESTERVRAGSLVSNSPVYHLEFIPPALSADGQVVATLANAPTPASAGSAQVSSHPAELNSDVYVVHIDDTPAAPVVTRLTNTPAYNVSEPALGNVKDVAISPDGTRVAFDTTRTIFAASPLALVSPPIPYTLTFETYEANLARGTLQQAVSAYDGSVPGGNAGLLSFSGDDETLAFASEAGNLFFGDVIGASEVYDVDEVQSGSEVPPQSLGPVPITPLPSPEWVLNATATEQADGSVLLDADVPGSGSLRVEAIAQLPALSGSGSHARRRAPRRVASKHGRKASVARKRVGKSSPRRTLRTDTVAEAAMAAGAPSQLGVRLRVTPLYRALVASKLGLYAILRVSFSAAGHQTLTQDVPVTFRAVGHLGTSAGAKSPRSKAKGSNRR